MMSCYLTTVIKYNHKLVENIKYKNQIIKVIFIEY